jgi:type IX secretion system PorP/SprF family membrane protein
MIKKLFVAVCILTVVNATAQQRPYYTQYILNDFIINPALAGIENYWDVKASHRHQWVGLNGAPVTTYLTAQGPLHKSGFARETPVTVHPTDENPRGAAYWQNYESTDPHSGVGLTAISDQTGPLTNTELMGTYAYHLPVGPKTSLSGGISLGFQQMRLDATKLNFGDQYPIDPAVGSSNYINRLKPDMAAGIYLYSANYFVGVSAQQIIPLPVGFNTGRIGGDTVKIVGGKLVPHLFIQGGYRMLLSEDISFLPSVTLKYVDPVPLSVDINAKFQYRDLIWTGFSIRPKDGFAAMLGLNINSTVNIGYSYDITTSKLNTVSKGTHEILIGFLIGNNYGDWCPRNVW